MILFLKTKLNFQKIFPSYTCCLNNNKGLLYINFSHHFILDMTLPPHHFKLLSTIGGTVFWETCILQFSCLRDCTKEDLKRVLPPPWDYRNDNIVLATTMTVMVPTMLITIIYTFAVLGPMLSLFDVWPHIIHKTLWDR